MMRFLKRTAGDVVAEIRMIRTAFRGFFLLVEGPTDSRFWRRHCRTDKVQVIICYGKATAIQSAVAFDNLGDTGVLTIIDDDYDSLLNVTYPSPNIIATETHDLDSMLIGSSALDAVLAESAEPEALEQFEKTLGISVRGGLVQRALIFGKLRLLALQGAWTVSFTNFSTWKYVDMATWRIDKDALLDEVAACANITSNELKVAVDEVPIQDPWKIIHGHDASNILAIALCRIGNPMWKSADKICSALRIAFTSAMFRQTLLYGQIASWQSTNNALIL